MPPSYVTACEHSASVNRTQLDDLTGVRSDGAKVSVSMQLARANFDGEPCMLVMAHDLSERKQFERKLRHLKRRDPTTGLFNHRHMRAKLDSLGKAANAGVQSAVILIELDNLRTFAVPWVSR